MGIDFKQNIDDAIELFRNASQWLSDNNMNISKWWDMNNLTEGFLLQYANKEEFYVWYMNWKPVIAAVLQISQKEQNWKDYVDKTVEIPALYIHWLCIDHKFQWKWLASTMINFAWELAKKQNIRFLRVDTNLEEIRLCKIYEKNNFILIKKIEENYRSTALYQKKIY